MPLYVVLHHPNDPNQTWNNEWLDERRIASFTSTAHIGELCEQAKQRGTPVRVHRCAYSNTPATISCSAIVKEVHPLPGNGAFVRFTHAPATDQIPPIKPHPGQNFYQSVPHSSVGS